MPNSKITIKTGWDTQSNTFYIIEDDNDGDVQVKVEKGIQTRKTKKFTLAQAEEWINTTIKQDFTTL